MYRDYDREQMHNDRPAARHVWQFALRHAWKLPLLPLLFDLPAPVKYACAAVLVVLVVVDVVRYARRRRRPTRPGSPAADTSGTRRRT
ncbi:hypothetical protein DSM104299_01678 [Baekduia alba]|nr:hypothetical protein DSM104299_01678 [Baekduia alba]